MKLLKRRHLMALIFTIGMILSASMFPKEGVCSDYDPGFYLDDDFDHLSPCGENFYNQSCLYFHPVCIYKNGSNSCSVLVIIPGITTVLCAWDENIIDCFCDQPGTENNAFCQ